MKALGKEIEAVLFPAGPRDKAWAARAGAVMAQVGELHLRCQRLHRRCQKAEALAHREGLRADRMANELRAAKAALTAQGHAHRVWHDC